MGKIGPIHVKFTNGQIRFKTGERVSGNAFIQVDKPIKIMWLKVQLLGWCKTKWKVGSGDDEKTYKGKEEYCSEEIYIWGGANQTETSITVGQHVKPFSFALPRVCPSSFESKHGNIWYIIQVTHLLGGSFQSPQSVSVPFVVDDVVDITANPNTAAAFYRPLQIQGEQEDDCGCCCASSARFDLTTDKGGYVPGDKIIINGYIDNGCDEPLEYTVGLIQRAICYGKRSDFSWTSSGNMKQKAKSIAVAVWKSQPIPRRLRKTFSNEPTITIPDVVASQLRNCSLIDASYGLQVSCSLPGLCGAAFNLGIIPLIIGSRMDDDETVPSAPTQDLPTYSAIASAPTAPPSDIVDVKIDSPGETEPPPPSYGEYMSRAAEDTQPPPTQYYDWSQSAFTYT